MTARLPYLYGIDSNSFRLMIGLGLIFLIPDFIKTIKEALGIKELPFNIGVGTFFGGVAAAGGGALGLTGQWGSMYLGASNLPVVGGWLRKIAGHEQGAPVPPPHVASAAEEAGALMMKPQPKSGTGAVGG